MWHQYHKRERFARLPQAKVLRCKECAEHTEVICSGCRQPFCSRHIWSRVTAGMFCWECWKHVRHTLTQKEKLPW